MIVLLQEDHGLRSARVGVRARVQAWLRTPELDRALAGGAHPDSSVELALHARRLSRPTTRCRLAGELERLVVTSLQPSPPGPRSGVDLHSISRARHELRAVADRLATPAPVSVRGVAAARLLLSDGAGPVYLNRDRQDLRARCAMLLASLDPLEAVPA